MIPPTCTDKTFSVQVDGPVSGVTYTLTQPGNNNPPVSILANGKPVIFTGLVSGDGFSVTSTNTDGCISSANTCGDAGSLVSQQSSSIQTGSVKLAAPSTKVLAAPNPFNDRIRFTLESAVSGRGYLELYNMMGQKVATVLQGYV